MVTHSAQAATSSFAAVWQQLHEHPIIAVAAGLYFGIAVLVGAIHETRFIGEVVLLGVRFIKHEVSEYRDLIRRAKRELTTWDP